MRLVLVRHAETHESARGRCYGTLDVGLSEAGSSQCTLLARTLAAEPLHAVISSPRRRAVETAHAVAEPHGLEVHLDPDLAELDFGELEGRTYDEIALELPEFYAAWMSRPTRVRFPGGEGYAQLEARARRAVDSLLEEFRGRTVVAVTHVGVVRAVLSRVLGIPDDRIFRIAVEPASLSTVEWVDGEPYVRGINDRRAAT